MKIKETIIGGTYIVNQGIGVAGCNADGINTYNSHLIYLSKDDMVRSIKKVDSGYAMVTSAYGGRSSSQIRNGLVFEIISGDKERIGKFFLTTNAGFLSAGGYESGTKESRKARLAFVKNIINVKEKENEEKEKEKEKIDEYVTQNKSLIGKLKDRIKKLEKFETDDEELTFTVSEIVKSGGDYSQITQILKDNNSLFIEKTLR